jgi:hypothetical protein
VEPINSTINRDLDVLEHAIHPILQHFSLKNAYMNATSFCDDKSLVMNIDTRLKYGVSLVPER